MKVGTGRQQGHGPSGPTSKIIWLRESTNSSGFHADRFCAAAIFIPLSFRGLRKKCLSAPGNGRWSWICVIRLLAVADTI
jgi:hypothetical protein